MNILKKLIKPSPAPPQQKPKDNKKQMKDARTKPPFSSNFLIVNHARKHRFVNVPKLGVSTLKWLTIEDDDLNNGKPISSPNEDFGYTPNGSSIVAIDSDEYSEYTTVAIWRDPVDRFYSWYKNKVLFDSRNIYIRKLALPVDNSIDRSIEFLKFELSKSDPAWMDAHLRPQADSYNPDIANIIVNMPDMSAYLKSIGVKDAPVRNSTAKIEAKPMTASQKKKVKELYAKDYQIIKDYKNKVWQR